MWSMTVKIDETTTLLPVSLLWWVGERTFNFPNVEVMTIYDVIIGGHSRSKAAQTDTKDIPYVLLLSAIMTPISHTRGQIVPQR